jgi:hypothetical protein
MEPIPRTPSLSRAFQRNQEHNLKHLVDLITTKQNKTKQTTFLHWYIASITWIKTKAHFTLGVRANVQPKSSIPIGAKDKEINPKGFTLGVKAEREFFFSTCPKLLINAELYGLVLAPRLKKNTIKFEGSICNLGANVLSMSSCQCSII